MLIKLIADRDNHLSVINDMKNDWINNIITSLNLNTQEQMNVTDSEYLDYLTKSKIDIIEYPSISSIQVKFENQLIGEFAEPDYNLKRDDKNKYFYYIEIECWSIFDLDESS